MYLLEIFQTCLGNIFYFVSCIILGVGMGAIIFAYAYSCLESLFSKFSLRYGVNFSECLCAISLVLGLTIFYWLIGYVIRWGVVPSFYIPTSLVFAGLAFFILSFCCIHGAREVLARKELSSKQ